MSKYVLTDLDGCSNIQSVSRLSNISDTRAHHRRTKDQDRTKTSKKSTGTRNNNSSTKATNKPGDTRNNGIPIGCYVIASRSSTSDAEFNGTVSSNNQDSRVIQNEPSRGLQSGGHHDGKLIGMHNN